MILGYKDFSELVLIHNAYKIEKTDRSVDFNRQALVVPLVNQVLIKHVSFNNFVNEVAKLGVVVWRDDHSFVDDGFIYDNFFVIRVRLIENKVVLEPVLNDFENLTAFLSLDLLNGVLQKHLNLG